MSELKELFDSAGVSEEKLKEIILLLKENPMSALSALQALNLPEDFMPKLMGIAMNNPKLIEDLALEMGVSKEEFDDIKNQVQPPQED